MKNFKVFKSSAGSGKTYTLVKQYLLLCLKDKQAFQFSKILAITFTNKAAGEMKTRIIKALEELAELRNQSPLQADLMQELDIDEAELAARSKACLTAILHNYADFSVSTIDKFSHKLIRTFAKDLGLAINFKVDLELDLILKKVISNTIEQVGLQPEISQIIISQAIEKVNQGESWDPGIDLLELCKESLKESSIEKVKATEKVDLSEFLEIRNNLTKENLQLERSFREIGKKGLELIEKSGAEPDYFYQTSSGIPGFFKKLSEFNYSGFDSISNCIKTVEEDKWYSSKANAAEKQEVDLIKEALTDLYYKGKELIDEAMPVFLAKKAVAKYLGILGLLGSIEKTYSAIKKENRLLPIADFNKKIAEVVLEEPMPFIYERLGEKYDHILIDEFQDTSVMQYMNLVPLVEESLARGNRNLIVGDAKQAIYRFRGGEVEQFSDMPHHLPDEYAKNLLVRERLENLKQHYGVENLDRNFRSMDQVVKFNNEFFEIVAAQMPERVQKLFEGHHQIPLESKVGGYVEVKFLTDDKEEQFHENQVLLDIEKCVEDGYQLSDITLLCRTKRSSAKLAAFLESKSVPLISSESLLLKSNAKVCFLVQLARYIQDPQDLAASAHLLSYLIRSQKIMLPLDEALDRYIREKTGIGMLLSENGFELDFKKLGSKSLFECMESLIRLFDLNSEIDIYLQFFMEAVFQFGQNESNSIVDFLEWWELNTEKLAIEVPEGIDAVQIMTLHKSKGLEFPVVIYPYAGYAKGGGHKNLIWVDAKNLHPRLSHSIVEFKEEIKNSIFGEAYQDELERKQMDLMNETYVAFTRAAQRLYIRAYPPSKSKKDLEKTNSSLSSLLTIGRPKSAVDIDSGYCLGEQTAVVKTKELTEAEAGIELNYHSESWEDKLKLSLDSSDNWGVEQGSSARNFGNLFHEVMAQIDVSDELEGVLQRYFYMGEINAQEKESLGKQIQVLLDDPVCRPLFKKGIKSKKEASLVDSAGEILRPDRVVYLENKVVILDYKTGEAKESHHEQMKNYLKTVAETTDLSVEGYLYYLDEFKAVAVA